MHMDNYFRSLTVKKEFRAGLFLLGFIFILSSPARSGEIFSPQPRPMEPASSIQHHAIMPEWTLELGAGIQFSNIRSGDVRPQTSIPLQLTLAHAVDEVSLDEQLGGILRGYTDFLFRVSGGPITQGQEERFIGMEFGPRYNFVQEGWKLVPFVEGTVGFWFVDSDPVRNAAGEQRGFGQDFNFMFSVAVGARYDFTESWFARGAVVYTHVSNADLSEPKWDNEAFDGIGPQVSLGYRF